MSDIKIGSVWANKSGGIKITRVGDLTVSYFYLNTPDRVYDSSIDGLLDFFEPKAEVKHSHYHKNVSDYDTIDVYVICDLYVKDNSGCIQHAVKKLLCCGERGVKDNVKDLQEAIDTIQRKIEILQGDTGLIEVNK